MNRTDLKPLALLACSWAALAAMAAIFCTALASGSPVDDWRSNGEYAQMLLGLAAARATLGAISATTVIALLREGDEKPRRRALTYALVACSVALMLLLVSASSHALRGGAALYPLLAVVVAFLVDDAESLLRNKRAMGDEISRAAWSVVFLALNLILAAVLLMGLSADFALVAWVLGVMAYVLSASLGIRPRLALVVAVLAACVAVAVLLNEHFWMIVLGDGWYANQADGASYAALWLRDRADSATRMLSGDFGWDAVPARNCLFYVGQALGPAGAIAYATSGLASAALAALIPRFAGPMRLRDHSGRARALLPSCCYAYSSFIVAGLACCLLNVNSTLSSGVAALSHLVALLAAVTTLLVWRAIKPQTVRTRNNSIRRKICQKKSAAPCCKSFATFSSCCCRLSSGSWRSPA